MVPTTNEMLIRWFALWPLGIPNLPGYPSFYPWQLVTYGFMHGGFGHLLFNMFAVWMFGTDLERVWGARTDRYSELRTEATSHLPRVEMFALGG